MGKHYIPQYYLLGFCHEGLLWVHDRIENRSFRTQRKQIGHETKIWPQEVEDHLTQEIENPANPVIDKVRNLLSLDQSERRLLAKYIYTLWRRVPAGRERSAKMLPEMAKDYKKRLIARIDELVKQNPSLTKNAEIRKVQIERAIEPYESNPPSDIWQKALLTHQDSKVTDLILSMNWKYIISSENQFLTCDNPVFFFEFEGLGKTSSELTVPFSSNVVLWANYDPFPPNQVVYATPQSVKAINRRVANNASRYLYSKIDEPWILPFHQKGSWQLNRLA